MALAIDGYSRQLPWFASLGDREYWPVPYRRLLENGVESLAAGFWSFWRFPRFTEERPFGFSAAALASDTAFLAAVRKNVNALEAFELSDRVLPVPACDMQLPLNLRLLGFEESKQVLLHAEPLCDAERLLGLLYLLICMFRGSPHLMSYSLSSQGFLSMCG